MHSAVARAPGRVNLIGEHTDYNGGFVLPCAIASATTAQYTPDSTRRLTASTEFGSASFDLDALPGERLGDWRDYLRGILSELRLAGVAVAGGEVRIESTLPIGTGLSSSASFEVALALALLQANGAQMDRIELAKLAQRAENGYTGTASGLMDQCAVLLGRRGNALLLDTLSLAYELVPVPANFAVVICNTMKSRELSAGGYNARRRECEQAVQMLGVRFAGIERLRDLTPPDLNAAREVLPDDLFRRCRHVVTENRRVLDAAAALKAGDAPRFGQLMNESHESLRDDFEVSSAELDILTAIARDLGAYGARMTGGGFGGCTVNVVEASHAASFGRAVARRYHERTGINAEIYDGTPADGASVQRA